MSSVNKVILIGRLTHDVDCRTMQSGDKVVNLNIATNEYWKDKTTGERKERTEFHRVVVFNKGLINVCENYLRKGSKIYVEGQLETRSWEKDGEKKYTTEVVLRPYRSEINMLDSRPDNQGQVQDNAVPEDNRTMEEMDDEIPF